MPQSSSSRKSAAATLTLVPKTSTDHLIELGRRLDDIITATWAIYNHVSDGLQFEEISSIDIETGRNSVLKVLAELTNLLAWYMRLSRIHLNNNRDTRRIPSNENLHWLLPGGTARENLAWRPASGSRTQRRTLTSTDVKSIQEKELGKSIPFLTSRVFLYVAVLYVAEICSLSEYDAACIVLQALCSGDLPPRARARRVKSDGKNYNLQGLVDVHPATWYGYEPCLFLAKVKEFASFSAAPNFNKYAGYYYDMPTVALADLEALVSSEVNSTQQRVRSGGAPPKYDWDEIDLRVVRYIHDNGMPATQAEMVRQMEKICQKYNLGDPSVESLKLRVRKLWWIMHEEENEKMVKIRTDEADR